MERASAVGEATPQRQYHLGMTYLRLGRPAEAEPLLAAAAAEPFPDAAAARAALESL